MQSRPGFEIVSPCPFPMTITITPRVPDSYKLVTLVEGDPKDLFSIATTPRCREGLFSILHFTLDPYSAEC